MENTTSWITNWEVVKVNTLTCELGYNPRTGKISEVGAYFCRLEKRSVLERSLIAFQEAKASLVKEAFNLYVK